jgi:hypothetical protein
LRVEIKDKIFESKTIYFFSKKNSYPAQAERKAPPHLWPTFSENSYQNLDEKSTKFLEAQ